MGILVWRGKAVTRILEGNEHVEIDEQEIKILDARANSVRRQVVRMIANAGAGHPGGSLSATDVIICLYFRLMNIDPANPYWPDRDRFVLSKGHACPPLYVVLAELGYFSKDHLMTFDHVNSILQGHPDMTKTPGIDMSTGSLGQGLSAAVGMALGARLRRSDFHTYCMLGDGELQEGQIWEAAMSAAKFGLDNLTAIVDTNCLQLVDEVAVIMPSCEPGGDKWRAFGWNVLETDGHDIRQILTVLDQARRHTGAPTVVISHTVKGKGVSFMEHNVAWHSRGLSPEELTQALCDLNETGGLAS
jgi:transketolase